MRENNFRNLLLTSTISFVAFLGLYIANKSAKGKKHLTQNEIPKHADEVNLPQLRFFDLTAPITPNTLLFPGDPTFEAAPCCSIKEHGYHLSRISMGNHTGTHIDFPAHVIEGGKTSSDYDINDLIGNGLIIQLPHEAHAIDEKLVADKKEEILEISRTQNAFVFFKTRNSSLPKTGEPVNNHVYIEPDAAKALLEMNVKVVGIDYISVDRLDAHDLPVHKILLSKGVLIVENLHLSDIPAGRYQISIAPPRIPDMDGLPVRAFAEMRR